MIRIAPGVIGQLFQVGLPVLRSGAGGWFGHQRLQALFGRWIALVVEAVELERLVDIGDIGLGRGHARIVGAVQHIGHDKRCQHANDDQHHHQLDQGEAA
ncbi:hypothetical protein SDC9_137618 [bioreactor metagenome]|uniref:Uncharacterized protein n=1 Tax=bioreactor metagenome TaxID=1076179 RepID=A0A645DMG9_9ZZZZ